VVIATATTDQIRTAMHRRPFVPFTLRLVDETSYFIKHPDFLAVPPTPRGREATHSAEITAGGTAEYTTHLIDLGLVLDVIVPGELPAQPAASTPPA
jgi:hypothetical protein